MSTNAESMQNAGSEKATPQKKKIEIWRYVVAVCGIIGFALIVAFTPESTGLTQAGKYTLGILFLIVTWWISEICSIVVTAFLGMLLMVLFKVADTAVIFAGFSNDTYIFLIFAFIIAIAVTKTGLGKRVAYAIIARTRPTFSGIMVTLALLGMALGAIVPSGNARTVIMGTIGLMLLPLFGQTEDKKSNVGRGIFTLLGLTTSMSSVAYISGGAGSILVLGLLVKAGFKISYVQWLVMFMPAMLLVSVLMALIIPRMFPPEVKSVSVERFKEFQATLHGLGPMTGQEKKAAVVVGATLFLWIIGSFINLSVTTVALLGAVLLMFPFIDIVKDGDLNKIGWAALLFTGFSLSLSAVLQATKVNSFLATMASPLMTSPSLLTFCLKIWLIATVAHFFLPGPLPAYAAFLPIIMASAKAQGFSLLIPVVVFVVSYSGFVMVYQMTQAVIAYGFKQFDARDLQKPGLVLLGLLLLLTPILVLYLSALRF